MSGVLEKLDKRLRQLERENRELRGVLHDSLPALGMHGRDFSQRALIAACKFTGSDPYDWTEYPDVVARLTGGRRRDDEAGAEDPAPPKKGGGSSNSP